MGSISEVQVHTVSASREPAAKTRSTGKSVAKACPKCHQPAMHRTRRKGLLQRLMYPLFGLYPWKCRSCKKTKMLRSRGVRKKSDKNG